MDYAIEEIQPNVWRVDVGGTSRIVRYAEHSRSFAPWEVCAADGRRLWAAPSLESAFRWIQARTGQPAEAILIEGLLGRTAAKQAGAPVTQDPSEMVAEQPEPADRMGGALLGS
jgi:hypothetical protein